MSFTIDFDSLMDGYTALLLQRNGVDVELRVPDGCVWLDAGVIVCGFFDSGVFGGDAGAESYTSIESAYETLNAMSPNTIYMERAFAVQPRNAVRDFVNYFRGKAFRDVYSPDGGHGLSLSDGCSLAPGKVLKRAPAYRFNASRHVVSLLRTIAADGARIVRRSAGGSAGDGELAIYSIASGMAPAPRNTVFLPEGVWLFNRCSDSYMAVQGSLDALGAVGSAFPGCSLSADGVMEIARISCNKADCEPLSAWVRACRYVEAHRAEFGLGTLADISSLRLDGSDFQFQPSAPDVLGYADYWFDTVKRMDIDVNTFRNAVYDYGTHIEDIVNDTYDLYPKYHNGPAAFDEAVMAWRARELDFIS